MGLVYLCLNLGFYFCRHDQIHGKALNTKNEQLRAEYRVMSYMLFSARTVI